MYRILRIIFLALVTVGALAVVLVLIGIAAWVRLAGTAAQPAAPDTTTAVAPVSDSLASATTAPAAQKPANVSGPAFIPLDAETARVHGRSIRKDDISHDLISWTKPDDWVDWPLVVQGPPHNYFIDLTYSSKSDQPQSFVIAVGDKLVQAQAPPTASWIECRTVRAGPIAISGGDTSVALRRGDGAVGRFMRVRHIDLVPVGLTDGARPVVLKAEDARLHGDGIALEPNTPRDIAFWQRQNDYAEWTAQPAQAGRFLVVVTYAVDDSSAGCDYEVVAGSQKLDGHVTGTGGWQLYQSVGLGSMTLSADPVTVALKPVRMPDGKALMNLRRIELLPME